MPSAIRNLISLFVAFATLSACLPGWGAWKAYGKCPESVDTRFDVYCAYCVLFLFLGRLGCFMPIWHGISCRRTKQAPPEAVRIEILG